MNSDRHTLRPDQLDGYTGVVIMCSSTGGGHSKRLAVAVRVASDGSVAANFEVTRNGRPHHLGPHLRTAIEAYNRLP